MCLRFSSLVFSAVINNEWHILWHAIHLQLFHGTFSFWFHVFGVVLRENWIIIVCRIENKVNKQGVTIRSEKP